ncbi:MAG TPA: aspartate kinase [Thermodesulfobacteriota bacterium]|nr:aspartate kinase [Thermodesulfobacteriota bacterium]
MALIVQKYGGTSVGSIERIRNVARRLMETQAQGHEVVAVVSAMAGETDRLIGLAHGLTDAPDSREYDVLVSTGEQVSIALLSIAIIAMGGKARSFTGHQVKILTDESFSKARIMSIEAERLLQEVKNGYIGVVAGFQGVDEDGNVTTLGRGGSDTSAVALAAALGADVCEIYTDVDGVYTADPNICPDARKLDRISYEEMLEMASAGAKVLHSRSVEIGKKFHIPILVRSSFSEEEGTMVTLEDAEMEKYVVTSVNYNRTEAKLTISGIPDVPGIAARIFQPIANANIVVDMIIQNVGRDGLADLTFTVAKTDVKKALDILSCVAKDMNAISVTTDVNISKISIVGIGMRSHAGVATKVFSILADEGINIMMISTSEIKISCVIEEKYTELAVRVLHDVFNLGVPQSSSNEAG